MSEMPLVNNIITLKFNQVFTIFQTSKHLLFTSCVFWLRSILTLLVWFRGAKGNECVEHLHAIVHHSVLILGVVTLILGIFTQFYADFELYAG